jgi:hypothetical protein
MTPKDLEDIRSWRRGEWVADITEIESMVYGLADELDRLRAAADGLRAWLTYMDSESEGLQFAQCDDKGRELGLWE